ncbi:hypothetical protein OF117_01170 [Geodermatophilus sp. YIM 151500]|uniref:hypothetical protein n=1 Tax=Geodermatophilus sp. YIM 151500 TaxID=2984531 RepID=UPI0021E3C396|nr:hypothetical protein [Geodermatophilus sp. YIM 151500]MCV2487959.1 hypothetical protein [Geodermatophilus sp. YIM 151500]
MDRLPSDRPAAARGVVRLLNTASGGTLCLAGAVDDAAVESFLRRYGPEPARVTTIDARSAISLSEPAVQLVLDHLAAAERGGRPLQLRRSDPVERLLARARGGPGPRGAATGSAGGAGSPPAG